ncbi:3-mercaptopyruvate sulfurtransferase [Candidatus Viadribacter manganicus]|uniref:Sulfurtransferase n=1 Tax=Candidatus Viadribacter manganicus TaxID=1759059 RepID=A0A1B1AD26_9PROT|nr:3-mercaptopyruvate sulfurtransferase [Candidatus Viadribacter manganicus]ANP44452.1 3-mercaptopyruvate sulfurtransferase [Candidatus Viadribacter manganicus]
MTGLPYDPLVSAAWLAERLDAPDIRVVDATWFMPSDPRDAKALYAERRIPGAIFFDIDEIADTSSDLPHMLPAPEKFASRMKKAGIGDGTRIIIYDNHGLMSAARVWWTFRVFGHEDVAVLDGGFPAWERGGHEIETDPPRPRMERHFTPRVRSDLVRTLSDIQRAIDGGNRTPILDARPAARFRGEAAEPRQGVRSGHMPGALNVPFQSLLNADGSMKSAPELKQIFESAGLATNAPPICSCGSGITAAVIALALARTGRWDAAVYDGSWTEWGGHKDTAVVTGA